MSRSFVNVVIPPLHQPFTYELPQTLAERVGIGWRVEVPFGRRKAAGFIVSETPREKTIDLPYELKAISSEVSDQCFTAKELEFYEWVAAYDGDTLSNVIDVAVPKAAPQKYKRYVSYSADGKPALKGKLQIELLQYLKDNGPTDYSELLKRFKGAGAALKKLTELGFAKINSDELLDLHVDSRPVADWAKTAVDLNAEQKAAVTAITKSAREREFAPYLLHGVTGSGKTEVYIEAIQEAVTNNMGALILVPEIALTPQLIERFRARLGNQIAILHSGLSRRTRWDSWRALVQKRNFIAIGARSAVFAPVPNLGLIIVDEEHDNSYKQSEGLRYNARDLAIARGKACSCPVVLGSATPSLETFHNAETKRYRHLPLPLRHQELRPLDIQVVDLSKIKPWELASKNVSPVLFEALKEALQAKEQAFILYNRRGFASYLQCDRCEEALQCPNCSVTMTYHRHNHSLLCHYCSATAVPPEFCAKCSATYTEDGKTPGKMTQRGAGTEKVFEELQVLFPDATIERLDRDIATDAERYRSILDRVRNRTTDILVGTQMIAKGHDLPGVTLVGVVDCDVGLHMPDFRAGERIFQLLTQVAGRAGRAGNAGKVILQTRVPGNLSIQMTLKNDYAGFAKNELASRELLAYPPYVRLLRVVASAEDKNYGMQILTELKEQALKLCEQHDLKVRILGPAQAPLEKLKTAWRAHMLVKSSSFQALNKLMRVMQALTHKVKKAKVTFDLDPQEML